MSLLFASGYLKIVNTLSDAEYELAVTNREVHEMFVGFVRSWFNPSQENSYGGFILAMLDDDIDYMIEYMQ